MNMEKNISEVFDIPDIKVSDFLLEEAFTASEINVYFGRTLITLNRDIANLRKCIENLNAQAKNKTEEENKIEKELISSKKTLIESKMVEKTILIELIKTKSEFLCKKNNQHDYAEKRDYLLSNLILHRAKVYRDKEWLKFWCQTNGVILDMEWFDQYDIYMLGNKRDSAYSIKNKLDDSREVYALLKSMYDKRMLLNGYTESQKEVAVVSTVTPYYLKEKLIENSGKISYIMSAGKSK